MSFTVYKSSAGSGKTYTLVKEYLKLVINKPDEFRHILAITFTNKAANEMKSRIVQYLKELSEPELNRNSTTIKTLLPELVDVLNLQENIVSDRAKKTLELILHNYAEFAISTIDSFFHKIVRTFAFDLEIPLNFEVELDTEKLINQAVDILISRVGNDKDLTRALVDFTISKTENDKSWHIENDLQNHAKLLFSEDSETNIDKLKKLTVNDFIELKKKIYSYLKNYENLITTSAKEAILLINENNIPIDAFYYGKSGIGSYFLNLSNGRFDKAKPNSNVSKTIDEDKWTGGKTDDSDRISIEKIKNVLIEKFNQIQEIIESGNEKYIIYSLLYKNIFPIAVLNEIEKIISEINAEENKVPISEFNKRISNVIIEESVPFIYERIGEKYHNFLIDEFQDTSVLQWQNLIPLIDNSLANNNFNMIVGDGKQAIYRWRSGDIEQFQKLPEINISNKNLILKERENSLKRHYETKKLDTNYRSKKEIVDFNNEFFDIISKKIPVPFNSIYDESSQLVNKNNKGGFIQIQFANKSENLEEQNIEKIIEIIDNLLIDNFQLKDIAILCRSNKNASYIARNLITANFNVISSESLLLSSSPKVSFIIACIKFLLEPNEDVIKTEIINFLSQTKKIQKTEFESFILKNSSTNKKQQLFIKKIEDNFNGFSFTRLKNLTIYEICEELIRIFNLNSDVDPYLQFFLDNALEFSIKNNSNISDFVDWWEESKNKLSIIVPEGLDAVNIMTIHKAKGLQFPAVIYPFASDKLKSTKSNLWTDFNDDELSELTTILLPTNKSLEETQFSELYTDERNKSLIDLINMLYVVMTRPTDRLYIISSTPSKTPDINSIPNALAYFLNSKELWEQNLENYEFGIKQNFSSEKIMSENYSLNSFISADWKTKILLSTQAPESWDIEDPSRNQEWGNLIHLVLSKIIDYSESENVLENLFQQGIIDKNEKSALTEKLKQIFSKAEIKVFFDKGLNIKNEIDILLPNGKTFRPDRVILEKEKAIIIDYKTGQALESHKNQLDKYADFLLEMGYSNIEKHLIYIDKDIELVTL
ncbi:MAG: UvrD-helicase domain-containing protein [Saprospiraceae bacterium]|nr:UvrD-helicase domain-containing protein [Saprospiraceae bacterium]